MSIVQIHQYSSVFIRFCHFRARLMFPHFFDEELSMEKLMKIYKKKTTA